MALAVQFIYGANYVVAKELMPLYIGAHALIFWRVLLSLVLFYLYTYFKGVKEKIDRKDFPRIIACGIFGVAVNMLCFFSGLALTSPVNASIIMITTPVLVSIMAYFFFGEHLSRKNFVGIFIGFAGAVWLIVEGAGVSGGGDFLGDILIFINASSYALYLVLVRSLLVKYNPILIIRNVFAVGFIIVIPFGLYDMPSFNYSEMPMISWGQMAYVLIATSFLAYLFNTLALRHLRSSVLGAFIYMQPLLATMIAIGSGKYQLFTFQFFAGLLIAVGVYLASRKTKKLA